MKKVIILMILLSGLVYANVVENQPIKKFKLLDQFGINIKSQIKQLN